MNRQGMQPMQALGQPGQSGVEKPRLTGPRREQEVFGVGLKDLINSPPDGPPVRPNQRPTPLAHGEGWVFVDTHTLDLPKRGGVTQPGTGSLLVRDGP